MSEASGAAPARRLVEDRRDCVFRGQVRSRYVAKSLIDRVEHCDCQIITPSKALSLTR
jgi:hypothetical protein